MDNYETIEAELRVLRFEAENRWKRMEEAEEKLHKALSALREIGDKDNERWRSEYEDEFARAAIAEIEGDK